MFFGFLCILGRLTNTMKDCIMKSCVCGPLWTAVFCRHSPDPSEQLSALPFAPSQQTAPLLSTGLVQWLITRTMSHLYFWKRNQQKYRISSTNGENNCRTHEFHRVNNDFRYFMLGWAYENKSSYNNRPLKAGRGPCVKETRVYGSLNVLNHLWLNEKSVTGLQLLSGLWWQ